LSYFVKKVVVLRTAELAFTYKAKMVFRNQTLVTIRAELDAVLMG
jgi:hypothetical protein